MLICIEFLYKRHGVKLVLMPEMMERRKRNTSHVRKEKKKKKIKDINKKGKKSANDEIIMWKTRFCFGHFGEGKDNTNKSGTIASAEKKAQGDTHVFPIFTEEFVLTHDSLDERTLIITDILVPIFNQNDFVRSNQDTCRLNNIKRGRYWRDIISLHRHRIRHYVSEMNDIMNKVEDSGNPSMKLAASLRLFLRIPHTPANEPTYVELKSFRQACCNDTTESIGKCKKGSKNTFCSLKEMLQNKAILEHPIIYIVPNTLI